MSNPFSGPYVAPAEGYDPARLPPRKPGQLMAVAIFTLTLGVLGLLAACSATMLLPFQTQMQGAFNPPPGPGAQPIAKLQSEMQAAMNAAMAKYFVGQLIASISHLVLATCMIIGAVLVLRTPPRGRKFLLCTLLAVIAFEVLRTVFLMFIQFEIMPITSAFADRMGSEAGQGGQILANIMKGTIFFSIVLGFAWPLIKIIVYAVSIRYLASKSMVEFFRSSSVAKQVSV